MHRNEAMGGNVGTRQSQGLALGSTLAWSSGKRRGHYQVTGQEGRESGSPSNLEIWSHLSPWSRGGRRCELECAESVKPALLECVSNTHHGFCSLEMLIASLIIMTAPQMRRTTKHAQISEAQGESMGKEAS